MSFLGVDIDLKLKMKLQSSFIGLVAIIVIVLVFFNDIRSMQQSPQAVNSVELVQLSPQEAQRLYAQPSGLSQVNYKALPPGKTAVNAEAKADYPKSSLEHFAMKLSYDQIKDKDTMVYFKGVFAEQFSVYDSTGKLLYTHDYKPILRYYTKYTSEFFVETHTEFVYLIGSYSSGYPIIGLREMPTVGNSVDSLTINLEKYRIRQAIALVLLLLSGILIAMIHSLAKNKAKGTIATLLIFCGLFGLWVLFDFSRHSYWIIESFPQLPIPFMILLFILAKNYMTFAFVQMNWYFLEKSFSKRVIEILAKLTFITGSLETVMEIIRFFVWNETLAYVRDFFYEITNWIIILGSLGLVLLAFYEAYQGSKKAIVLSIGLTICLITFFISQSTPILISHWGVLAMITSIAVILSMSFNEAQQSSKRYTLELRSKNDEMALLNLELEYAQTELLLRLGSTVDMRSHETSLHVQRVAEYTKLIATKLGLSHSDVDIIVKASTLHDVGKVGIPDSILHLPGKLTAEQYEAMKQHARMGFEMLNGSVVQVLDVAAVVALTHHEKYDGTGYPEGLKGEDIPIQGLIVSAADVLDALLSKRVYKKAWTLDEVIDFFNEESGKHFQPNIAQIIIDNRSELEAIIANLPYEDVIV